MTFLHAFCTFALRVFYGGCCGFTEWVAPRTYTSCLVGAAVARRVASQVVEAKVLRSMYVPLDLWVKAREEAARRGTSVNQIVVEALRLYLKSSPFFLEAGSCLLLLLPLAREVKPEEWREAVERVSELLWRTGTAPELERLAERLAEELEKEKRVSSGG